MKYLCLVYADEARLDAMPQPEVDALIDETATTNEAVRIAGRIPGARLGSVEVRPVIDLMRERSPR